MIPGELSFPVSRQCSSGDNRIIDFSGCTNLILSAETPIPFKVDYETPDTLGMDRLAAIAGAYNFSGGNDVLVIDAGSAITFDTIVNGRYPGGSISPGLSMRFKALNEFTARLPLVMPSEAVNFPARNTRSAIATGVVEGLVFEINEYIRRFRKEGGKKVVFLTGGDSVFLLERIDNEVTHLPELVLEGLNFILEYNA